MPKVVSINVNPNGGVPKYPTENAYFGKACVKGDKQNDTIHHGGIDRAVCLFSMEIITSGLSISGKFYANFSDR